jgi:hypothetical protein
MALPCTWLGVAEAGECIPITVETRSIGEVRVEKIFGEPTTIEFEAGMAVDADGAARAYHPDDTGLDRLEHAGGPGSWWALATDEDGEPFVQGKDDPAPGFYVSTTSLVDESRAPRDPRRYVDSAAVPYVALPALFFEALGCKLGDVAWVERRPLDGAVRGTAAILADVAPPSAPLGEGSIALAQRLGIPSDPRVGGTRRPSVRYALFCGAPLGWPRPVTEIDAAGERAESRRRARDAASCPRR